MSILRRAWAKYQQLLITHPWKTQTIVTGIVINEIQCHTVVGKFVYCQILIHSKQKKIAKQKSPKSNETVDMKPYYGALFVENYFSQLYHIIVFFAYFSFLIWHHLLLLFHTSPLDIWRSRDGLSVYHFLCRFYELLCQLYALCCQLYALFCWLYALLCWL